MNPIKLILSDIKRKKTIYSYDNTLLGIIKTILTDGTSAIILYRLMQYSNYIRLAPLAWLFQYLNKIINGCIIGRCASFEAGLVLAHPIGIVINSSVIAGRNITIQSSVIIGENKGKSPLLANNIFIGSGAKIFGQLNIGNNVLIGANAVVTKNIDNNQKAFGVPANIIKIPEL